MDVGYHSATSKAEDIGRAFVLKLAIRHNSLGASLESIIYLELMARRDWSHVAAIIGYSDNDINDKGLMW